MHYASHHEMAYTIEVHLLNSISVPNFVSLAQNFLEPEDPLEKTCPVLARAACTHNNDSQKGTHVETVCL